MARTNIDIDEVACARVMERYGFTTKREAVNYALAELAQVATLETALAMRGIGWSGDLDAMRNHAEPDVWDDE